MLQRRERPWILWLAAWLLFHVPPAAPAQSQPDPAGPSVSDGCRLEILFMTEPGVDGIALLGDSALLAVQEADGSVLVLRESMPPTILIEGLRNPEGIAVGDDLVYVVEDAPGGSLISIDAGLNADTVLSGLRYPEGVCIDPAGRVLVSQSTIEGGGLPPFSTSVGFVSGDSVDVLHSILYLWSYSGIDTDSSGVIYACNELSGFGFVTESIIRIDPVDGTSSTFTRGLTSPEGICFSPGGTFPLYVVEEDTGEGGRIIRIDRSGNPEVFARGFLNLEDVAVDSEGRIYVSQDTDGTIYRISVDR